MESGKRRKSLRLIRDQNQSKNLPASEAKPRFERPMKSMGGAMRFEGTALGPEARRLARGVARGRTARNMTMGVIEEAIQIANQSSEGFGLEGESRVRNEVDFKVRERGD